MGARSLFVFIIASLFPVWAGAAAECETKPKARPVVQRPAGYAENQVKKNCEKRFAEVKVTGVSKSPLPGIYEVVVEGDQLVYANRQCTHVLVGNLLEGGTNKNLTQSKLDRISAINFESLPLGQAIRFVNGNGSRPIAVFSDPDCSYCRGLESELAKLDDATIFLFPYPASTHPEAQAKSKQAWCSAEPAKAWREMVLEGKAPAAKVDCANPIASNISLGDKLNITGTPTIFLGDGRRVRGLVTAAKLNSLLAETGK